MVKIFHFNNIFPVFSDIPMPERKHSLEVELFIKNEINGEKNFFIAHPAISRSINLGVSEISVFVPAVVAHVLT